MANDLPLDRRSRNFASDLVKSFEEHVKEASTDLASRASLEDRVDCLLGLSPIQIAEGLKLNFRPLTDPRAAMPVASGQRSVIQGEAKEILPPLDCQSVTGVALNGVKEAANGAKEERDGRKGPTRHNIKESPVKALKVDMVKNEYFLAKEEEYTAGILLSPPKVALALEVLKGENEKNESVEGAVKRRELLATASNIGDETWDDQSGSEFEGESELDGSGSDTVDMAVKENISDAVKEEGDLPCPLEPTQVTSNVMVRLN
ncbi:hypothetical protein U1Q18_012460 [Sarracenia purpurea var. burkii]